MIRRASLVETGNLPMFQIVVIKIFFILFGNFPGVCSEVHFSLSKWLSGCPRVLLKSTLVGLTVWPSR